jgi:hypothetical protein
MNQQQKFSLRTKILGLVALALGSSIAVSLYLFRNLHGAIVNQNNSSLLQMVDSANDKLGLNICGRPCGCARQRASDWKSVQ